MRFRWITATVAGHFTSGWHLMAPGEKRLALILAAFMVAGAAIEMVSLALIMPLIGLFLNPENLQQSRVIASLHDLLAAPGHRQLLVTLTSIVVFTLALATMVNVALRWAGNALAARCRTRLATDLACACAAAPYAWFLERNSVVVARQINEDVAQWARDYVGKVFGIGQGIVLILFSVALIIWLAPLAGILAFLFVGSMTALLLATTRRALERFGQLERKNADRASVAINQLILGIKDVKLSTRASYFVDQFRSPFSRIGKVQAGRSTLRQCVSLVMIAAGQIGMIGGSLALWLYGTDASSVTEQIALLAVVASRVLPGFNRLYGDVSSAWDVRPYIESLTDLVASLPSRPTADRSEPTATSEAFLELEFDSVTFLHHGAATPSVCDISCRLAAGGVYGVAGPSGAGKTTMVDLLFGLIQPTAGKILMNGKTITLAQVDFLQSQIGYVPQSPFILDDTLATNISFGEDLSEIDIARVHDCAKAADLEELIATLPMGLRTPLGDRGMRLSGGQRQRVAIARALYRRPSILVLDEATSALDVVSENAIRRAIANLRGRVTIVIIAHRLSAIRDCDKIFLLERGRLVAQGRHEQLIKTSPLYQSIAAIADSSHPTEEDMDQDGRSLRRGVSST